MAKIEPAVLQLSYDVPAVISYIDLAKDLSLVNRRLYRQGYTYVVQDVQLVSTAGIKASDVTMLQFSTVGNSWIVHNAWRKGFAAWRKQQKEITDGLGPISGKWADFKVYLDDTHEDIGTGTLSNLIPVDGNGDAYQVGEWIHSKLVFDDDGTEREFKMCMIGTSNLADTNEESGIALIEEYADSRRYPTESPALAGAASNTIYAKLLGTDEMSDMLVDNIEADNDVAPYEADDYPGGSSNADHAVPVRVLSCTGGQGTASCPGFIVPLGLIKIENVEIQQNGDFIQDAAVVTSEVTSATARIILTLAPGPYRGVLAAPMGQ